MQYRFVNNISSKQMLIESLFSGINENKKPLKVDGEVMGYLSKELNTELIKVIKDNSHFSNTVKQKFELQIKAKKVVPAYSSQTWLGDIFDTFTFIFRSLSGTMLGFYDGKRIVLMIANLRNFMGDINSPELYDILAHEHQHKFSNTKVSYHQSNVVKKTLNDWFSYFIDDYFGTISNKHKDALLSYFTNIKAEYDISIGRLLNMREKAMLKMFKQISDEDDSLTQKLLILYNYISQSYSGDQPSSDEPYNSGKSAYRKIGINSNTWIFQEFVVPSEVICVTAGNNKEIGNKLMAQFL